MTDIREVEGVMDIRQCIAVTKVSYFTQGHVRQECLLSIADAPSSLRVTLDNFPVCKETL